MNLNFIDQQNHLGVRQQTRRHFFGSAGINLGSLGLASLLLGDDLQAKSAPSTSTSEPHFTPKAKRVIHLFMAGGPSQLELFDYKPKLQEMHGQVIPESYVEGKNFAFLKKDAKLLGTQRKFKRWGQSGQEISELLPHLGKHADDIAIIRSMKTEVFNHGPAKLFANTGFQRFGRPSMGAWVTYGIGSESQDLPGFLVMNSGPRGPRGGTPLWGSGFLPTTYQGVPLLNSADPILNLSTPPGIESQGQAEFIDTVSDLNNARLQQVGDPEIATRIASYEMAYRMQSSAPELMDLRSETQETLTAYGITDPAKPSFARNCLLARRLIERGTRFVQLFHTDWDHHGNAGTNLGKPLEQRCAETDQPAAALIQDLKNRGMLEDTLVMWGGEFGRTPQGEPREKTPGRDHHIEAYSMWLCGGGIKGGTNVGQTDELGYYGVEDVVPVHDLQATVLHCLGLDHKKLIYRFQGRDYRLTDVGGNIVTKILA